LKLTGEVTHILARRREIHTPRVELSGLILQEIAAIAHHDTVCEPMREGLKQFTIIAGDDEVLSNSVGIE
jgi:hypothetical protein